MDIELSVVIPMFDEAEAIAGALARVSDELVRLGRGFEVVCVDDGSRDGTAAVVSDIASRDAQVVLVQLSRNFGKESAIAAGLEAARGRAVVVMDADLQHPPEVIASMVAAWEAGAEVVTARKSDRGRESFGYRLSARLFYGGMGGALGAGVGGDSDFKLLDRQVVDVLRALPERSRYFRGLVVWVGFRTAEVPFVVAPRHAGTAKWSTFGLFRYAVANLLAFTSLPLRLVGGGAAVTIGAAMLLAAQTLWNWWTGRGLDGFTTVILVQLVLASAILGAVAVVGLYVGALYDEVKGRPIYVVRRPKQG